MLPKTAGSTRGDLPYFLPKTENSPEPARRKNLPAGDAFFEKGGDSFGGGRLVPALPMPRKSVGGLFEERPVRCAEDPLRLANPFPVTGKDFVGGLFGPLGGLSVGYEPVDQSQTERLGRADSASGQQSRIKAPGRNAPAEWTNVPPFPMVIVIS